MEEIKLFALVLSLVFCTRFIVEFIIKLFDDNPTIISINKNQQTILYFAISYIITYFLI